jgi:hypothetical protein
VLILNKHKHSASRVMHRITQIYHKTCWEIYLLEQHQLGNGDFLTSPKSIGDFVANANSVVETFWENAEIKVKIRGSSTHFVSRCFIGCVKMKIHEKKLHASQ